MRQCAYNKYKTVKIKFLIYFTRKEFIKNHRNKQNILKTVCTYNKINKMKGKNGIWVNKTASKNFIASFSCIIRPTQMFIQCL